METGFEGAVLATGDALAERLGLWSSNQNEMLSPLSAEMAMGLALLTSDGDAERQILELFGIASEDDLMQQTRQFRLRMGNEEEPALHIANAIWVFRDISVNQGLIASADQVYGAELNVEESPGPQVVQDINAWVAENTRGRINQLIDQLDPAASVGLFNALAFDGTWEEPFKPEATSKESFAAPNGEVEVDMMRQSGEWDYRETEQFQAVDLPYEQPFRMHLVLPREGVTVAEVMSGYLQDWQNNQGEMAERSGQVRIPKFEFSAFYDLVPPLKQVGVPALFTPGQGFLEALSSSLNNESVDVAVQKTYIKVDEEGTEAAAATGIVGVTSAAPGPEEPFQFVADRPFAFFITENRSGAILFMGVVNDPTAE
jgi:serpin B